MNVGLYSGISAVRSNEKRLEAISANLANIDTPGFKRHTLRAFSVPLGDAENPPRQVSTATRTDFSQGALERTGNPLDLALLGPGFFTVEGDEGELFSRRGIFQLDDDGNLITEDGFPVAWEGQRGQIDPVGLPVVVESTGTVRQGAATLGRLKIVAFAQPQRLTNDVEGYYSAPDDLERAGSDAEVHQFTRERSNVSSVDELVALISAQRSFESATKLMQMLDETYRQLNNNSR